ncbi:3-carboxy-cis,cis-muconate cycloisomerase [Haloechinothrix sp. YIM 98757]|uniref:3-carboxy-cis,cis-muconate cycloisomerase n=1 Tax=Haloechinothrix aidingensis TaxID=2752311 RepID=A0A838ABV4_9PSEU|nr:3-carboxy-cis,cis-muconate cycloisomerase [Haloechinothrix aidingensis]MBA0126675.1 3-carboxy-cis,cis-muconate cycloisomerase [Haloechinothrix aidingensis]
MSELFDPMLAAGPVRAEVDDTAWLQAMLDFEAALARAEADCGLLPAADAERIAGQCRASNFDPAGLGAEATGIGNPAGPLVRALSARVDEQARRYVHFGATSQDVLDTATMLVSARALDVLLGELAGCGDALARLAEQHAATVQSGRTLLQQAQPVTFGLTAACWLSAVSAAREQLSTVRGRLAVQLGGATGTLASLGAHGPEVVTALAGHLELADPGLPWHTDRSRVAELASALGAVCAAVSKIARDVTVLAQTEVAEAFEVDAGAGGSSAMPHKRNPVAAVAAAAASAQAPGLVSTLLGSAAHELQRAAGAWHAEWRPLGELLRSTGSAVAWLRTSLDRLRVDPTRMRENLDSAGGLPLAERVTTELVEVAGQGQGQGQGPVGRLAAHDAVADCCRRAVAEHRELAEVLAADGLVGTYLSRQRLAELLDPAGYLGSAGVFVERALARHRAGASPASRDRRQDSEESGS